MVMDGRGDEETCLAGDGGGFTVLNRAVSPCNTVLMCVLMEGSNCICPSLAVRESNANVRRRCRLFSPPRASSHGSFA